MAPLSKLRRHKKTIIILAQLQAKPPLAVQSLTDTLSIGIPAAIAVTAAAALIIKTLWVCFFLLYAPALYSEKPDSTLAPTKYLVLLTEGGCAQTRLARKVESGLGCSLVRKFASSLVLWFASSDLRSLAFTELTRDTLTATL